MEKKKKILIIGGFIISISMIAISIFMIISKSSEINKNDKSKEVNTSVKSSSYAIQGNGLDDFDLYFLKQENGEVNKVYSPLSIKYALAMLKEGTDGDSYTQINQVFGKYNAKKYTNSANMSLANGLFIRDSFKGSVKTDYINNLSNKFNAEVIYDDFSTPNNINSWVSNKTFNLVNNLLDDVSEDNFVLINALAIDMEWVKKIQSENENYSIMYNHETTNDPEDFYESTIYDKNGKPTDKKEKKFRTHTNRVTCLSWADYSTIVFNDVIENAKVSTLAADVNRYDVINTIGEENIRTTVKEAYKKWVADGNAIDDNGLGFKFDEATNKYVEIDTIDEYLDKYIDEISKNYNQLTSSTDFSFYVDDDIKVFAKDLKEYNGITLEYIGIMPTNKSLKDYIKDIDAKSLNSIISNIKPLELSSFKDGYITQINGSIPLFQFEYNLNLVDDLKNIGITDVFDQKKANLSKITSTKDVYITDAKHKANIEFSNDGIKASAATSLTGGGASGGGFDYLFNVPIEKIDLTFNKPYMFIIRDKESGEVWFTGTVYEPIEYQTRHWWD